jgi:hypothetical protein
MERARAKMATMLSSLYLNCPGVTVMLRWWGIHGWPRTSGSLLRRDLHISAVSYPWKVWVMCTGRLFALVVYHMSRSGISCLETYLVTKRIEFKPRFIAHKSLRSKSTRGHNLHDPEISLDEWLLGGQKSKSSSDWSTSLCPRQYVHWSTYRGVDQMLRRHSAWKEVVRLWLSRLA